ncbi:unnamed protein product [Acanthosepion pharaonis]|uniref:Uncharacterized protein n=1 Tax=Acanthosepion pharaonis TaxID=158019 RepID=A0A812D5X2_ACAPH|nr:unnamed protein product [Sepia pharaonis]
MDTLAPFLQQRKVPIDIEHTTKVDKLLRLFCSTVEIFLPHLIRTNYLMAEFSFCNSSQELSLINTGITEALMGLKSSQAPLTSSSVRQLNEAEEIKLVERHVSEMERIVGQINQRIDHRPWESLSWEDRENHVNNNNARTSRALLLTTTTPLFPNTNGISSPSSHSLSSSSSLRLGSIPASSECPAGVRLTSLSLRRGLPFLSRGPPGWGKARMTLFSRTSNPFLPLFEGHQRINSLYPHLRSPSAVHHRAMSPNSPKVVHLSDSHGNCFSLPVLFRLFFRVPYMDPPHPPFSSLLCPPPPGVPTYIPSYSIPESSAAKKRKPKSDLPEVHRSVFCFFFLLLLLPSLFLLMSYSDQYSPKTRVLSGLTWSRLDKRNATFSPLSDGRGNCHGSILVNTAPV